MRFSMHLLYPFIGKFSNASIYRIIKSPWDWLFSIPWYMLDLMFVPECYELINEVLFPSNRYLNQKELIESKKVFKGQIDYSQVRLNAKNLIAKKLRIAYVSFNHVNYYENIPLDLLIHELVHVWQYQQFGSVYIYHALKAQKSNEGYDYGGITGLWQGRVALKDLIDFNFEQQGDIVQDYYLLKRKAGGFKPDELVYHDYINSLQNWIA